MNCAECREKLVKYIEGLLTEDQRQRLTGHIEGCNCCRLELDELTLLGQRIASDAKNAQAVDVEDAVLNLIIREQNRKLKHTGETHHRLSIWRFVMKTPLKLTAAAVILIAVTLSLTMFDKTVAPAYGLEQTIEACHSVRFIHMRQINPQHEDEQILIWAEFFENGLPKRIRLHLPEWSSGGSDGAQEVIWENNTATIWFKKKNLLFRAAEKAIADKILKIVQEQDPKTYVRNLLDAEKNGKVEILIDQPADKAKPISVTAIHLPERTSKLVLYVDQATQLPLSGEKYILKGGNYVLTNIGEFYDYNQPIDAVMFTFDNIPEDVMRIDQTTQTVGLPQGQMTNDEMAVEVVRQFWQALINKDYAKASQMYEGIPAAMLEKAFEDKSKGKIMEIVSVGPVQPHPNQQAGAFIVPCTLKIEENGQIHEQTFDKIGVRQVMNQPGRWTIFGGL